MPPLSQLWVERGQRSGHSDCMGALDGKMEPHSLDDGVGTRFHEHGARTGAALAQLVRFSLLRRTL